MRLTLILALVCLATLMAGCGTEKSASNEGSSSEGSGKPLDNMCKAVAPEVPEDWGLTETSVEPGEPKTDCTLRDKTGETVLIVGLSKPKSGSSVDDAYKKLCDFYIGNAQEHDDKQCTHTGPIKLEGSPTELQRGVRLDSPPGVLWLTFQTNKPDVAAEAEDVLGDVESAVSGN